MTKKILTLVWPVVLTSVLSLNGCQDSGTEENKRQTVSAQFHADSQILPSGLPFSDSVRTGNLLFLSGQLGTQPGKIELVKGGIKMESRQALKNIESVLKARGLSMKDVVKCTVMLDDISEWKEFNQVYKEFFQAPFPARSAFGTNGLALGAKVEIECIAMIPE